MWIWGCLTPHPPIIVPEVGQGRERDASATLAGMDTLAARIRGARPDVLLVLSPHAPFGESLVCVDALWYQGGLQRFGVPDNLLETPGDREAFASLFDFLLGTIPARKIFTDKFQLDHASVVPLTWFRKAWKRLPPIILANPLGLDLHDAYALGRRLAEFKDSRKWGLLSSGDLSHRVTPEAPAGYEPDGARFDGILIEALRRNDPQALLDLDAAFVERAGECGLRSVLALMGLAGKGELEVFSYEAPFGVGYGTAIWDNMGKSFHDIPALARKSIHHYLENGRILPAEEGKRLFPERSLWETTRPCFVSLKTRTSDDLRGCIGTLEPTCPSLGEEIIQNAVSSATRDPRFEPVKLSELTNIRISVDVLGTPELVGGPEELDPKRFGVIVEKNGRRGVLLPNLEEVDTVREQLLIASRKAGLHGPEGAALRRFTVDRFREEY